jgi:hypothetical protein
VERRIPMAKRGPATDEGKTAVRHNGVVHGLTAADIIVGDEIPDEWREFHDAIVEGLQPEDTLQRALASRAAELLWRLRRVAPAEAIAVERDYDRTIVKARKAVASLRRLRESGEEIPFYARTGEPIPEGDPSEHIDPAGFVVPNEATLRTIIKFEAHLNRQLMHTLHELEALQARRRGDNPFLSRVDVHGLPGT